MRNWENIYKDNYHNSVWPWTEIISLVSKYINFNKKNLNILEIGAGYGANIPFLIKNNNYYYGNEESKTAYKFVIKKFSKNKIYIENNNFLNVDYKENFFDIIIDRASITHNNYNDIQKIVIKSNQILKSSGIFVSTYLFSKNCSSFKNNNNKKNTIENVKKGFLKNVGTVSFFNKKDIKTLFFNKFQCLHIEKNDKSIFLPVDEKISWWNIVLKKNEIQ